MRGAAAKNAKAQAVAARKAKGQLGSAAESKAGAKAIAMYDVRGEAKGRAGLDMDTDVDTRGLLDDHDVGKGSGGARAEQGELLYYRHDSVGDGVGDRFGPRPVDRAVRRWTI